jgi:hypothetical protein
MTIHMGTQRLLSQGIQPPHFSQPAEVVRWMGAMQAQDYHQAVWAIGARIPQATLTQIEQAIAAFHILRTWPMRGTIHFVAPEDARWMLRLLASKRIAKDNTLRQRQLGIDPPMLEQAGRILESVLHGQQCLTRAALLQHFEAQGIPITGYGQRGYHLLAYWAQKGLICIGPNQAKEQTFALLEDWVPQHRDLEGEAALVELARRYFRSHGPATVRDLAWWAGLTLTEARRGLAGAQNELTSLTIGKDEYWWAADAAVAGAAQAGMVLLPGYDEFLLGYTDRTAVLDAEHAEKVCPGGNGVFAPMVIQDGRIVGTWKRTLKKGRVEMTCAPFTTFSADEHQQFRAAAERYAHFHAVTLDDSASP